MEEVFELQLAGGLSQPEQPNMSAFTTIAKNITLNYSSTYSFYDRDTNGREINQFMVKTRNQLMRMEGTNLALGFRFQSKNKQEPARSDKELTPEEQEIDR